MAKSSNELLFCSSNNGFLPWDSITLSRMLGDLLRRVSGIETIVFHHFRHTALSNLQVIIEKEWRFAEYLTGHCREKQEEIYIALGGRVSAKISKYWYLAKLAGHVNPETTFRHYLHFCELVSALKINQSTSLYERQFLSNVSGLTLNKITRTVGSVECKGSQIRAQELSQTLRESLSVDKGNEIVSLSYEFVYPELEDFKIDASPSHDVVLQILRHVENERPIEKISEEFLVCSEFVEKCTANFCTVKNLSTREGRARLLAGSKSKNSGERSYLPVKPNKNLVLKRAEKLFEKMDPMLKEGGDAAEKVKFCIKHYLLNSRLKHSYISFADSNSQNEFTDALAPFIKVGRWEKNNHSPATEARIRKKRGKKIDGNFKGHYHLYLREETLPSGKKSGSKRNVDRNSAPELRYVFVMLAIKFFHEKDRQDLANLASGIK